MHKNSSSSRCSLPIKVKPKVQAGAGDRLRAFQGPLIRSCRRKPSVFFRSFSDRCDGSWLVAIIVATGERLVSPGQKKMAMALFRFEKFWYKIL